ncbi:Serine proteases trypsin domain, partial [Trinorchestia longiramus]
LQLVTWLQYTHSFTADRITVRLGEYTFDNPDDTAHYDYPVKSIQEHEAYDTTTFVNDIAILSLPESVVFNDDVWPVCLPQPGPLYTDEQPTVTGWGTIYYGGPVATTLQEVTIPVWSNEDCDDTYEQTIVDTVMCAGAKTGGKDSCQVSV